MMNHFITRSRNYWLKQLNIQLYDVSLRDGIQALAANQASTEQKKEWYHQIMKTHSPSKLEVGSFSSLKMFPIMADTPEMVRFSKTMIREMYSCHLKPRAKTLVLVPNQLRLQRALDCNPDGVSFITSVSEAFQKKNTRKTLQEAKRDILEMTQIVKSRSPQTYIKLYVSCINECPLDGKMEDEHIASELVSYSMMDVDEICLSDTCGTLEYTHFQNILNLCLRLGIPISKISLHLHVYDTKRENIRDIVFYSLDKGLTKFDVSMLETGGCSTTMGKYVKPNMTYDLFYDIMDKYVEEKKLKAIQPKPPSSIQPHRPDTPAPSRTVKK